MRRLLDEIRTHSIAAALFVVLWAITWTITVVTWERDAAGYSVGMASIAIPLHLLLPLVLGVLVGSGSHSPRTLTRTCGVAGLVFGFVHFAILWLVDVLWLPEVESRPPFADLAAEAVGFTLVYAIICVVLAIVGGRLGSALATRFSHGTGAAS